jgi:hypothetical protein
MCQTVNPVKPRERPDYLPLDKYSSLSKSEQLEHPSWVGRWREVKQMIAETQGEYDCFV